MYTVFVGNKKLMIADVSEHVNASKVNLRRKYASKNDIIEVLNILETDDAVTNAIIYADDFQRLWSEFESLFSIIEAAGGLVINKKGQVLVIFRRGKWDLPKGKVETDEQIEDAAIREVEEECCLSNLTIVKQIYTTYHTYELEGVPVLKESFWFLMNYDGDEEPKPQVEEGITEAIFINRTEIESLFNNTYASIKMLLKEVFI